MVLRHFFLLSGCGTSLMQLGWFECSVKVLPKKEEEFTSFDQPTRLLSANHGNERIMLIDSL